MNMTKKLIAMLLALILLVSVSAFAEETEEAIEVSDYEATDVGLDEILNFGITMDDMLAGYTMETFPAAGALYATIISEDENAPVYLISVDHSEIFDGYTLNVEAMTAMDLINMETVMGKGYYDPAFSFDKTSHGTDVILVNENTDAVDYAEYVTIYEGYFVTVCVVKNTALNDEDLAGALKLLSDMWIVPVNAE